MKRSQACADLAHRYGLPQASADRFQGLLELLRADPRAPTSVVDPTEAVDVHLADGLSGLEVDRLKTATCVADVGSGAGLPGLVLAIAMPQAKFDLIEAAGKKCEFIDRCARELSLANVTVVHDRSENWAAGDGFERYQATTVRAVARLSTLIEYASPLLQEGGVMVAWKGAREKSEELAAARAAARLAMSLSAVDAVHPYQASRDRHLYVYEKTGSSPEGIPRRPGVAAKRPLG